MTLVDAVHGEASSTLIAEVGQAGGASQTRLLLSEVGSRAPAARRALRDRLARLNPGAEIHEVIHGAIEPDVFCADSVDDAARGAGVAAMAQCRRFHDDAASRSHDASRRHAADRNISAFCIYRDRPVTRAGLVMWLDMLAGLRGANLLRVKGLLNVEGEPVVVHAVQTLLHEPVDPRALA